MTILKPKPKPEPKPAPACHEHARELLAGHGIYLREIVRVDADAILFINPAGRPMTGWLETSEDGRKQKIVCEGGFPAWPGMP